MGVKTCEDCGHVWNAGFLEPCPRCRQMERDRETLRAAEQNAEARHQAEMSARREADEAADQRHREQLAAAEDEREARHAQARAAREAIAAADDRQRNAPRLLAEGECGRAATCLKLGDIDGGLRHARRAVDADATYASGRVLLAVLLHQAGNTDEASTEAARAFTLSPSTSAEKLASFYPPAQALLNDRARKRAEEEARARAEADERQRLDGERQRLLECERQVEAARQQAESIARVEAEHDAANERWRSHLARLSWRALFAGLAVALLGIAAQLHLLPTLQPTFIQATGIFALGFVAPAIAAMNLAWLAARGLDIEASDGRDLDRRCLRIAVGSGIVFVAFYAATAAIWGMDHVRCRQGWAIERSCGNYTVVLLAASLAPVVSAAVAWYSLWVDRRRMLASSANAPVEGFKGDRAAELETLYVSAALVCTVAAAVVAYFSPLVSRNDWHHEPEDRASFVRDVIEREGRFDACWRDEIQHFPASGSGVAHVVVRPEIQVDDRQRASGIVYVRRMREREGQLVSLPDDPAINQRISACVRRRVNLLSTLTGSGEGICAESLGTEFPLRNRLQREWQVLGPNRDLATTENDLPAGALLLIDLYWNNTGTTEEQGGFDVLVENGHFENPTRRLYRWNISGAGGKAFAYVLPVAGRVTIVVPPPEQLSAPVFEAGLPIQRISASENPRQTQITLARSGRDLRVSIFDALPTLHSEIEQRVAGDPSQAPTAPTTSPGDVPRRGLRGRVGSDPIVRMLPSEISGNLAPDAVRRIALRNLGQINQCHLQGLAINPNAAGRITVRLVIGGSTGSVILSRVATSTYPIQNVGDCIANVMRRWQFPLSEGGALVAVNYVFSLQSP